MSNIPERLEGFLVNYRSIKKSSEKTINGYRCDIALFFKFLKHKKLKLKTEIENVDVSNIDHAFIKKITEEDLDCFIIYASETRNNGDTAIARKVAAIKSFYKFLYKKKIIDYNIASELETPKLAKKQPVYLQLDEAERFIRTVKARTQEDAFQQRDECIITIFLNCGIRLSELIGINIKDININSKTLTVTGKGNKQRTAYLNDAVIESLNNYLEKRQNINSVEIKKKEDIDALFISKKYNRMSERAVQNVVKKYIELAGLDPKYTPHKLRHTSATLLYKHGADIIALQKILGHENVSTTQIYTHIDDEQLHNVVELMPRLG